MAFDTFQFLDVIEAMVNFIEKNRPPEHIRNLLDLGYKIQGQSILVFEIRPRIDKPQEFDEYPVAKTTFVKAKNHWKVFWLRSNLKWHRFQPQSTVKTVKAFCKLIEEDKLGCFYG